MMLMDRDAIAAMLPHAGAMCLLDGLLAWDRGSISCVSRRYLARDNPLRRADGTLGIAAGIELAAQAMALHGGLIAAGGKPTHGVLASVRDVRFAAAKLDAAAGEVAVDAELLAGDAGGATYRFALTRNGRVLLSGRATVILETTA